jgi:hypothetical protein
MKKNKIKFRSLFENIKHHTESMFDTKHGQLKKIPRPVVVLSYVMCLNILFQGFMDIIIKFGGYTPWIIGMPWRIDFLFLTGISVLMGFQTLIGMRRRKLDVTRNSVQVGLLVETALIVGDLHFISVYGPVIPEILWFRIPFIALTLFNVWILFYIIRKMNLFWGRDGVLKLF